MKLGLLVKKAKLIIAILSNSAKKDDYDWNTYTALSYVPQLKSSEKRFTQRINVDDYVFEDFILKQKNNLIIPLHFNHRLLYETILQLQPQSVVKLGCGAGDHCHNLKVLQPNLAVHGLDVSENQLELLRKRNPNLNVNDFKILDLTLPIPQTHSVYDIAFTQAVIMHIHEGKGHLIALSNLFRLATQAVILMENWLRHDFMADISYLHKKGIIPWDEIYFHYRSSPERGDIPHLMVVSKKPITKFEVLTNYALLSKNVSSQN